MENQLNGNSPGKKMSPSQTLAKPPQIKDIKDMSDVKAVAENLFENADEIAAQLKQGAEKVGSKVKDYGNQAAVYVKRNPGLFAAFATALVIFFVAQIFRTRKS